MLGRKKPAMSTNPILDLAERLERSNPEDAHTQRDLFEHVRALRTASESQGEPECQRRLEASGMLIGYLSQMGSLAGNEVKMVAVRLLRSVVEQQTAEQLRKAAQAMVGVQPVTGEGQAPEPPPALPTSAKEDRSATDVLKDALLGQILLQRGHILEEHIQAALRVQRGSGLRMGDVLVKIGACSRQQVADALQYQASMRRARSSLAAARKDEPIRIKPKESRGLGLRLVGEVLLGEILVERGVITRRQLEKALEVQKLTGKRIGEALVEMGATTPETIDHALRVQGGGRSFSRGGP